GSAKQWQSQLWNKPRPRWRRDSLGRALPRRQKRLFRRALGGGLVRDDLVFDLVVSGLRNDLLYHQVALGAIRPVVNDLLRQRLADAGQGLKLLLGGRIDVQLLTGGGSLVRLRGRSFSFG